MLNIRKLLKAQNEEEKFVNKLISFVVPFYNEFETLSDLFQGIDAICQSNGYQYELVFVDDGSTDPSSSVVKKLIERHDTIKLVELSRNFGKSAALSAGFSVSFGDIVITMDADLQDDPVEIPKLIHKINEGFDVVSGWKINRLDPLGKTLPSRLYNGVTSRMFKTNLHDMNCGFKAYTKRALTAINLYGEHHRFIPVLLASKGFKVAEVPVHHSPRRHGVSKFGHERILRGLFDALTILMLSRFKARPLHFIGLPGLVTLAVGFVICLYLAMLWFIGVGPIGDRPLLLLGILCIFVGVQLLTIGLLAELLVANTIKEQDKYVITAVHEKQHES